VILSAKSDSAQRAFRRVVIDLDLAFIAVAHKRRPACERIADGDRDLGFSGDPDERGFEPVVQRY
jgi:hypothetical protein